MRAGIVNRFDLNASRAAEVRAMRPFPGCFVQLTTWYGDIWGEVLKVFDDGLQAALILCASSDRAPEYTFFYNLRPKVEAVPPPDARIVFAMFRGSVREYRIDDVGRIAAAMRNDMVCDVLEL